MPRLLPRLLPRLPITQLIALLMACSLGLTAAHAAPKKSAPNVKWKLENGLIDNSSVCYNHKRGSIKYRDCRRHAVTVFKQRCAKYKDKVRTEGRHAAKADKAKKDRYCRAQRSYNPH